MLGALPDKHPAAVGFVFLVNGKPRGAELYATPALFRKLWMKGLRAAAALSEMPRSAAKKQAASAPLLDDAWIAAWLAAPHRRGSRTKTSRRPVTDRVTLCTRETATQIAFETLDHAQESRCIHSSILAQ